MAGYANQLYIGGYAFGVDSAGLDKLSRSSAYNWPSQQRIARPPAAQFVGAGDDTISISGYLHPAEVGSGNASELDTLRDMANEGIPYMVVSGTGKVFGKYVIESVDDDYSAMLDDLRPRRVDFTLKLKRYGNDM